MYEAKLKNLFIESNKYWNDLCLKRQIIFYIIQNIDITNNYATLTFGGQVV